MDAELGMAFWAVSLVFVITPGADWAYALTAGVRYGRVAPAVTGLLAGHVATTGAVVAGVAAILAGAPLVLSTLTVMGAVYLLWLGASALRRQGPAGIEMGEPVGVEPWRHVVRGFAVSGLNPKALLLLFSLLPQFTTRAAALSVPGQMLVLGLMHVLNCAIVYTAVAVLARRVLGARPGAARVVGRLSGATMVAIGAVVLTQQLAQAAGR